MTIMAAMEDVVASVIGALTRCSFYSLSQSFGGSMEGRIASSFG